VLCAASQRLALGRREGTSRVAIGPPRSAIRGRKAASMPEAPTLANSRDHLGGAAALVRDVGASMPKGLESSTSVTTTPPAWCDRKPPESSSSSRSNATTSAGTSVVRRTSAPSSAGSTVLRSSWVDRLAGSSANGMRGDVSVNVRLRPGSSSEDDRCAEPCRELMHSVRLRQIGSRYDQLGEAQYQFDHVFPEEASQEEVFNVAVAPICEAVISGYNGAVIAYGQTGSGKTHTVVGTSKFRGVAPRAIHCIFDALAQRTLWSVDVSVLEIYNERVRDLLSPGAVTHVDVHEVRGEHEGASFRCPDAARRQACTPEEALAALAEGMKRRETARTDMNHHSSRSHLIFTLTATQRDPEIGATLRGRLHLVDLAGSERLKRSMSTEFSSPRGPPLTRRGSGSGLRTPRDQRREAGEINKSLSQLALVIQRLTSQNGSSMQLVPYRDSMLTRLLAESFGGSSKTCLIITCSVQASDREETRCSLEFGKRAKLVRNRPQINLEVAHEPSAVVEAFVAKKLEEMQRIQEELLRERELLQAERSMLQGRVENLEEKLGEAVCDLHAQQNSRLSEATQLEEQKAELQERLRAALAAAVEGQDEAAAQVTKLNSERQSLQRQLTEMIAGRDRLRQELHDEVNRRGESEANLYSQLADRQRQVEEVTRQAAELRVALADMGREKAAALAAMHEEQSVMRAKWLEDVSRLEAEKLALQAGFEAEKAVLREQLERDKQATMVASTCSLGVSSDVQEAAMREEAAHQESFESAAQWASRSAELRHQLQAATEGAEQLERLRQARLMCLEAEAQDMQAKWQQPVAADEYSAPSRDADSEACTGPPDEEASQALPSFPSDSLHKTMQADSSLGSAPTSPTGTSSGPDAPSSPPATRLNSQGLIPGMAWEGTKMPPLLPSSG